MKPVAIIGGGITGLTAAFRLKEQGIPVKLFEAGSRVGGVIQSVRKDGHLAEFGPNSILETSPVISALVKDLGLESRRVYSSPAAANRYIVRNRKPVALPGSPLGFLATPLFSVGAKLRLLAEPFISRAPFDVEESLATFVQRRLGQEFLDYAINPFVAGVYAGAPEQLSVKYGFPKLHALEQKYRSLLVGQVLGARERKRSGQVSKQDAPKLSFDDGLQVLIDTLEARLAAEIETSSPVRRLTQTADGWTLTIKTGAGERQFECGSVLLAMPAHKIATLEAVTKQSLEFRRMEDIYYPPVASVVLGYSRDDVAHPLDGFGMLIPEKERFNILGALFSSTLFPNRAPEGRVTITCFLGGARAPSLALNTPEVLEHLADQDLRVLLGIKGSPVFYHSVVYRKAIPQYNVGFGSFKDLMNQMESKAPGLFVAGHARDGVSLGDSLVSGHNVAGRIRTYLGANDRKPVQTEARQTR